MGVWLGPGPCGGTRNDNVVVRVALHVGDVAPATPVQVVAVAISAVPFIKEIVPAGLAPLPVPVTVAVKVTLPPEEMLVAELVRAVVVLTSPLAVRVNVTAPEVLTLKLGSPLYCAVIE